MSIVLIVFIVAATLQFLYYVGVFSSLAYGREPQYESEELPAISLIICAKNEAENLRKNLKFVLIQNYKNLEVIIVNDQSTDDTLAVLDEYYQRNPHLRIINIKEGAKPLAGKKFALKVGIEQAKNDVIVVTDADCKPVSAHWLEHLVGQYLSDTDFVLGYSPFHKEQTMLNTLIRYENVVTAMQYFSWAKRGMPYMGVGRNMTYRKSAFTTWLGGYELTRHLPSGDDDLLVNAQATKRNTEICLHKDSFVFSEAKTTWGEWLRQKQRHTGAAPFYKWQHQIILFLFAASNLLFYTLFPVLCVLSFMLWIVIPLATVVMLVKYYITSRINIKLQQKELSTWFFFLDPLYVLWLLCIFITKSFISDKTWK